MVFHANSYWLKNVSSTGWHSFTPFSKVQLLLSQFIQQSQLLKNSNTKCHLNLINGLFA